MDFEDEENVEDDISSKNQLPKGNLTSQKEDHASDGEMKESIRKTDEMKSSYASGMPGVIPDSLPGSIHYSVTDMNPVVTFHGG